MDADEQAVLRIARQLQRKLRANPWVVDRGEHLGRTAQNQHSDI